MTEDNPETTIHRRDLLRSATAAGFTLGGLGQTAAAQETSTGASVQFAEVRLSHQLSLPDPPHGHYPTITVDEASTTHLVDRGRSKLYLNEARDRRIDILRHNAVVANGGYSSLPTELGGSPQSAITTGLHPSYRVDSSLIVEEYTQPQISVTIEAEELSIAAEGHDTMVPIGAEQVLRLPEREVTVEVFEYADEEPPERDDNRPVAPLRDYRDVELTVKPEIHARNHGELTVATVNSPSAVPHPPEPQN